MDFSGKVVLITGASSGIGAGTAEYFSRYGATLALVGRNAENLKAVAEGCAKNYNNNNDVPKPLEIVADVNVDAHAIVEKTISQFGRIDILINNAGIGYPASIETVKIEDYDEIMSTNVRSVFQLTSLVVPHLIASKGNIVNVSSVAGTRASIGFLAYSISKSALDQLTKCISLELAPKGVRVNSVNPAAIVTNFQKQMGLDEAAFALWLERMKLMHPIGRHGEIEEVAAAIAFLANDSASFITGTLFPVCGGRNNLSV